ncbi:hypothetical protein [Crassaminicella profunda]|uniref:hypothetical protein n=1 Tax=Crassaminicella profunda TaxID=1286698 RepID=UPI001CA7148D|nr:hypothetical protein [Crassaminicella profunda]QZY54902.1 hypothetical protein K7H06_18065 [Crassaminicella profunda]
MKTFMWMFITIGTLFLSIDIFYNLYGLYKEIHRQKYLGKLIFCIKGDKNECKMYLLGVGIGLICLVLLIDSYYIEGKFLIRFNEPRIVWVLTFIPAIEMVLSMILRGIRSGIINNLEIREEGMVTAIGLVKWKNIEEYQWGCYTTVEFIIKKRFLWIERRVKAEANVHVHKEKVKKILRRYILVQDFS